MAVFSFQTKLSNSKEGSPGVLLLTFKEGGDYTTDLFLDFKEPTQRILNRECGSGLAAKS